MDAVESGAVRGTVRTTDEKEQPVRRLAAVLLPAALVLSACGGSPDEPDPVDPTSDDLATLQAVQVEGEAGAEPTVTFDAPFEIAQPVAWVETEGDGDELSDGNVVTVHYVAMDGEEGSLLGSTWETDEPEDLTIGDPQLVPALTEALEGQRVGARLLFAAPGGEETEVTPAFPSTVMVVDVIDVREVPDRATGTTVEPVPGLPTVTLDEDGAPTIDVEGVEVPEELVVQPLIEGDGPEVQVGQSITINYHGVLLADGEVFDSSWERGAPTAFTIGTGQLIPGWDQGIPGQTVGSQVLLVIPAELAYGEGGSGNIPPDAPLVFVVDILDAR